MGFALDDVMENLFEGVSFVDLDRRITFWNRAAERIAGYTAAEVLGTRCCDNLLMHVDEQGTLLCVHSCSLSEVMTDGRRRESQLFLNHKNGHRIRVSVRFLPLRDETGATVGGVEIFTDSISLQAVSQRIQELEKLALLDPLTRLSNRAHLETEIEARLQEKERYGLSFGVLFLDIDRFKDINDTYGHPVGDRVLRTVAETLRAAARPFDVFGRWGGEEFVGIIRNVDPEALSGLAGRCRALVASSRAPVPDGTALVTISVGATLARDADTPDSLIQRADRLMYESKLAGRNRVTLDGAGEPSSPRAGAST